MNARRTIFQLYFDYIQHFGSAITPRALVRLTTELGISPNATRAALCRLAQQGWLKRTTANGQTSYLLTPLGRERLDEIHPRLFSPRHGTWDGRWTILTYSVPERLARHRDRLRRELTFLGYGSMTPATWISPNPLVDITLRHLSLHNLEKYVCLFRAQHIRVESPALLIKRCYRLDAVQRHYARFIKSWRTYTDKINVAERPSDSECFVAKIKLLYAFGDSLYLDPFLPAEFLPSGWLGYEAWRIFRDSYLSLMEPALAFFESCYEGSSEPSVRAAGRLRAMEQAPFDAYMSA